MPLSPPPSRNVITNRDGRTLARPWWRWLTDLYESATKAEIKEAVYFEDLNADLADQVFYPVSQTMRVEEIREIHANLGTDSGDVTVGVTKESSTEAPAAGDNLLASDFDLKASKDTMRTGTLTTTSADLQLAPGDRLSVNFSGTLTGVTGLCLVVRMRVI